jgi:hypothetical protein
LTKVPLLPSFQTQPFWFRGRFVDGTHSLDSLRGWWIIDELSYMGPILWFSEGMMDHWSSRVIHGTHSLILWGDDVSSEWSFTWEYSSILRGDGGSLMNWALISCLLMQISLPESSGQKAHKIVCRIGGIEWPISTTSFLY